MDSKHVLVIDADQDLAPLVREVLEDEGWQVSILAETASEPIRQAVARLEPDCILLDGQQRGDYGSSWLQATVLHERARRIPVIMFTVDKPATDEAAAGESGRSQAAAFAAILPKPFEVEVLVATVARVVRGAAPHPEAADEPPRNGRARHERRAVRIDASTSGRSRAIRAVR